MPRKAKAQPSRSAEPAPPLKAQLIQSPWYKNPLAYFALASAVAGGFSAYAAVTSARLARSNLGIAQGQAAITRMQYTPQLSLDVDPVRSFKDPQLGPLVGTTVHVKNVGNITVYNAVVSANMGYLPPNEIDQVWSEWPHSESGITLAPTEDEKLEISYYAPTDRQFAQMQAGKLKLVVVGRFQFTDELGRNHNRYACAQVGAVGNMFVGQYCPTPPQG